MDSDLLDGVLEDLGIFAGDLDVAHLHVVWLPEVVDVVAWRADFELLRLGGVAVMSPLHRGFDLLQLSRVEHFSELDSKNFGASDILTLVIEGILAVLLDLLQEDSVLADDLGHHLEGRVV